MRVLLVDYLSPKGHEGWFRLQYECLVSLGNDVKCVISEGFASNLGIVAENIFLLIPQHFYSNARRLKLRLQYLKILLYLKKRIKKEDWDLIVLTSYETISLGMVPILSKSFIVNHNNLSDLRDSSLKYFFYRRLSTHYYHIAFNTIIADRIREITNQEAIIVPHGLISINYKKTDTILKTLQLTPKKYILSPTKSYGDMDVEVMESICNSVELNSFLKHQKMKMVLRSPVQISNDYKDNYVFVLDFLACDDYYNLLSNSYALILCLNEEAYCYRVSAVLFECMKLNLPIYVYSNRTLDFYSKYMKSKMTFVTTEELVKLLLENKFCPWKNSIMEISNPAEAWQKVLKHSIIEA